MAILITHQSFKFAILVWILSYIVTYLVDLSLIKYPQKIFKSDIQLITYYSCNIMLNNKYFIDR